MNKSDGFLDESGLPEGPEGAVVAAHRLNRFMLKLLSELQHLGGDRVSFKFDNQLLHLTLGKRRQEIRSLPLRSAWFEPIADWFFDRAYVLVDDPKLPAARSDADYTFQVLVRLGNQGVRCQVERARSLKGAQTLTCTVESQEPISALLAQLQVSFEQRKAFEYLISSSQGTLLVGGPDEEQRRLASALFLSLTGGFRLGELSRVRAWSEVGAIAGEALALCSVCADDAASGLLQWREQGIPLTEVQLLGVIIQGLAPNVCVGCAKSSIIEPTMASQLPTLLRPPAKNGYAIGRGCERCRQRGTSGVIGIQSVVRVTPDLEAALTNGASLAEIVERTYAQGTRSLMEDGFHKAMRGAVTIEGMLRVSRTLPSVYQALLTRDEVPSAVKPERQLRTVVLAGDSTEPVLGEATTNRRVQRTRARILVVEDDADQRQILEMVFRSAGYDVVLAGDGIEALEQIQKDAPELIVADLMMPRMDGTELVRRLKADPVRRTIPILILTVVSDLDKEYALLDQGADDYCEKTIQRRILLKRVENLVRRNHKNP